MFPCGMLPNEMYCLVLPTWAKPQRFSNAIEMKSYQNTCLSKKLFSANELVGEEIRKRFDL